MCKAYFAAKLQIYAVGQQIELVEGGQGLLVLVAIGLLWHPIAMKTHYRLLKAIRIANDISQRQMAELAGVSERSIANMEVGRDTTMKTTSAVQAAFEKKGVRFLPEAAGSGYGVIMPEGWTGPESLLKDTPI